MSMGADSYANTLQSAHLLRTMAANLDSCGVLDEAIAAIDRADSVGAILDPTTYQAKMSAMQEDRATLLVVRELARLGVAA